MCQEVANFALSEKKGSETAVIFPTPRPARWMCSVQVLNSGAMQRVAICFLLAESKARANFRRASSVVKNSGM